MKKLLALAGLLVFGIPAPSAFSLGLFLIQSAAVTQLDADSYRLRMDVYWAGEPLVPPAGDPNYLGPGLPYFSSFGVTTSVDPYNLYSIQNGEAVYSPTGSPFWTAIPSGPHNPGNLGTSFGFDFDYTGSLANMPLTYIAGLEWYAPYLIDAGGGYTYVGAQHVGSELFGGQFLATAAPEPGTLILVGIGAAGIIATRLRRRH